MVGVGRYTEEQIKFICDRRYEHPQDVVDACYQQFPRTRDFKVSGIRYVLKEHANRQSGIQTPYVAPMGVQSGYNPNVHRAQFQSSQFLAEQMQLMQNHYPQQQQAASHQIATSNMADITCTNETANQMSPNMQMSPQMLQQFHLQQAQLAHLQSIHQQSGQNQNGYLFQPPVFQNFQVEQAQNQGGLSQPALFENSQAPFANSRPVQFQHAQAMAQPTNQKREPSNGSPQAAQSPIIVHGPANNGLTNPAGSVMGTPYIGGINAPLNDSMTYSITPSGVTAIGLPQLDTASQILPQNAPSMANQPNIETVDMGSTISSDSSSPPGSPAHKYRYHPVPRSSPYHPSNQLPSTKYLKLMKAAADKANAANKAVKYSEAQSPPDRCARAPTSNGCPSPASNTASNPTNVQINKSVDCTMEPQSRSVSTPRPPEAQKQESKNTPAMVTYNITEATFPQKFYLPRADSGWTYSMKDQATHATIHSPKASLPDFTVTNGVNVTVNLFRPKFMGGLGYESPATVNVTANSSQNMLAAQKPAGAKLFQDVSLNMNKPQPEKTQKKRSAQNETEEIPRPPKQAKVTTPQPSTPKRSPATAGERGLMTPPATLKTKAKPAHTFPMVNMQARSPDQMIITAPITTQSGATKGSPTSMNLQSLPNPFRNGHLPTSTAGPSTSLEPINVQSPLSSPTQEQIKTPQYQEPVYDSTYWSGPSGNLITDEEITALLGDFLVQDSAPGNMFSEANGYSSIYSQFQHDAKDYNNQNDEDGEYETDDEFAHRTEANGYLNVDDIFGNQYN